MPSTPVSLKRYGRLVPPTPQGARRILVEGNAWPAWRKPAVGAKFDSVRRHKTFGAHARRRATLRAGDELGAGALDPSTNASRGGAVSHHSPPVLRFCRPLRAEPLRRHALWQPTPIVYERARPAIRLAGALKRLPTQRRQRRAKATTCGPNGPHEPARCHQLRRWLLAPNLSVARLCLRCNPMPPWRSDRSPDPKHLIRTRHWLAP